MAEMEEYKVKDKVDILFENVEEDDKTSEMEPCQSISTQLYKHQKQALSWMVRRENGDNTRPLSVCGGILADDMGLGKTLVVISLILSNYKNGDPLVMPVPGKPRLSKILKIYETELHKEEYEDSEQNSFKGPLPKYIKLKLKPSSPCSKHSNTETNLGKPKAENGSKLRLKIKGVNRRTCFDFSDLEGEKEMDESTAAMDDMVLDPGSETDDSLPDIELPDLEMSDLEMIPDTQDDYNGKQCKLTDGTSIANLDLENQKDENYALDDADEDFLPDLDTDFEFEEKTEEVNPVQNNDDPFQDKTIDDSPRATLIVCPPSVISIWLQQLEEHLHENVSLDICVYHGTQRERETSILKEKDVVLTTYNTITADSMGGSHRPLQDIHWLRIVLDEGHIIRNPNAKQTHAIYSLCADRKWVLTGTPIQNYIKDLWSLIIFLNVYPFTDRQIWLDKIQIPLKREDPLAMERVQKLVVCLSMRRTKTQFVLGKPIVDLPSKTVNIEYVKLSTAERKFYDTMETEGKEVVERYLKQGTLFQNYGTVLVILLRLRQICCHLSLLKNANEIKKKVTEKHSGMVTDESPNTKENLLEIILEVLTSGSDEICPMCVNSLDDAVLTPCSHVFCRQCIKTVMQGISAPCPLCRSDISLDNLVEVPPEGAKGHTTDEFVVFKSWQTSAKVDALMQGLMDVRREDPSVKSLVISQFTSFLNVLETPLRERGFKCVRLDGSMSNKHRIAAIERFSDPNPSSPTIFLLSLKAGGVGLNLVAASRVFLMEPAWNPASEEQAFDRCHRLGQTREVKVTKFIVEDSVELRMLDLQDKKTKLIEGAFGKKTQTPSERLNDLMTLMDLRLGSNSSNSESS